MNASKTDASKTDASKTGAAEDNPAGSAKRPGQAPGELRIVAVNAIADAICKPIQRHVGLAMKTAAPTGEPIPPGLPTEPCLAWGCAESGPDILPRPGDGSHA